MIFLNNLLLIKNGMLLDRLSLLANKLQTMDLQSKSNISTLAFLSEVCHIFLVFSNGSLQNKMIMAQNMKCIRFILQTKVGPLWSG